MLFPGTRFFVAACFIITLSHCANPFAPTGGPKDTSPPLALVSPKDTIVNYAGEKLIWAFDEYLQPIQKQNIQILPETPISVELRGRSLILSIEREKGVEPLMSRTVSILAFYRNLSHAPDLAVHSHPSVTNSTQKLNLCS